MTFNRRTFSQQHARTYASASGLDRALVKYGLNEVRHLVYQFADGRYTAVFLYGADADGNGSAIIANHLGFPGA